MFWVFVFLERKSEKKCDWGLKNFIEQSKSYLNRVEEIERDGVC